MIRLIWHLWRGRCSVDFQTLPPSPFDRTGRGHLWRCHCGKVSVAR